jgi:hypothetical protein
MFPDEATPLVHIVRRLYEIAKPQEIIGAFMICSSIAMSLRLEIRPDGDVVYRYGESLPVECPANIEANQKSEKVYACTNSGPYQ